MATFTKFNKGDIFQTVVHATPHIELASGSGGWRGNIGTSASLSLYEGIRSRYDVKSSDFSNSGISVYPLDQLDTYSIDKVVFVSGTYPSTGSIRLIKARRTAAASSQDINETDWYEEHFNPIMLLYDYYSALRPDIYFTGSYDYYCLNFRQNDTNQAYAVLFSGSELATMTSSFTIEAWIKPSASLGSHDFTIASQRDRWKFYIDALQGYLAFSDFASTVSASTYLTAGVWQHVAVSYQYGLDSASFYLNGESIASVPYTGTLLDFSSDKFLTVGAEQVLDGVDRVYNSGFDGFMFETKIWDTRRTAAQISGNFNSTLTSSGSINLLHYARFNDGPFGSSHGMSRGSGAFDHSSVAMHGELKNYETTLPITPIWQPNDNPDFVTSKKKITDQIDMMLVLHVPSMCYGRQIATGSVRLACNAYDNHGIMRVLCDDGMGGLYLSGSLLRHIGLEDYAGPKWNKVGNVFYAEGLITITDPSLLDFGGRDASNNSILTDKLQVSFDGLTMTHSNIFNCRLGSAQYNCSNNPSFSVIDDRGTGDTTDDRLITVRDNTTYVTAIGIYNERHDLVAIAKLAQPIRKREKDKILIRLRHDI